MPLDRAFLASLEGTGACKTQFASLRIPTTLCFEATLLPALGKAPAASWEIISVCRRQLYAVASIVRAARLTSTTSGAPLRTAFIRKMQADTEEYLREAAGRGHEMVQQMVQKLSGALIYPDAGNVQTNEKLWDVYASEWGAEAGWVAGMAASNRDAKETLENVGDEWAPAAHTKRVVDEWILSEVSGKTQCCEIGSGGGRIGRMVAPRVAKLQCFDVSAKMLAAAKQALSTQKNVAFAQVHGDACSSDAGFCDKPRHYAPQHEHAYDFVYCFDVMVHMDAHAMFRCLKRIRAGALQFLS